MRLTTKLLAEIRQCAESQHDSYVHMIDRTYPKDDESQQLYRTMLKRANRVYRWANRELTKREAKRAAQATP